MIIVTVGIPNAGKSTWGRKLKEKYLYTEVISRDDCRISLFGENYYYSKENENKCTKLFDCLVEQSLKVDIRTVLDNTHCKESYLDNIIKKYEGKQTIQIKVFPISLWKAYWREFWRRRKTGKKVPYSVIKNMQINFDKINWYKYEQYILK